MFAEVFVTSKEFELKADYYVRFEAPSVNETKDCDHEQLIGF
jgi:hypothetical protein